MWTADFRDDARFGTEPGDRARGTPRVGIVAGLAVPMRVAGRVIGVLSVGNPTPRVVHRARDRACCRRFADQAAVAISNAQTQEALAQPGRAAADPARDRPRR